jgi:hypothetical protein
MVEERLIDTLKKWEWPFVYDEFPVLHVDGARAVTIALGKPRKDIDGMVTLKHRGKCCESAHLFVTPV